MATFDLLADLPLEVERYTLDGLSAEVASGMQRATTVVTLHGRGLEGAGEDVTYDVDEQAAFQQAGPIHDLAGKSTLAEFCERIESLDMFPEGTTFEVARNFRVWAFESAALDLALRQARDMLWNVLDADPAPMRYVASLRLGEPPHIHPVWLRLELDPNLRFKLDATSSWTPELIEQLVETGAVESIDFKALYHGSVVDQGPDPVLYRRVVDAFPEAWLEDPDVVEPSTAAVLAGEHDRITWDAAIHSVADIEGLPFPPKMVNIKPSRLGSLRELFAAYDYCSEHEIGAYGGGQTELGVGRGQAQYLASLFHPRGPNDLAPSAYNLPQPPAGLPRSPLIPTIAKPGFRWGA
jgi:hypothetical protein